MPVQFELFGVPRLRAGQGAIAVEARTLGEALRELARECPALAGSVIVGNALHPAYKLSLNGEQFVTDPALALSAHDCLLLLAADAGG
jgi:hypothetical protein